MIRLEDLPKEVVALWNSEHPGTNEAARYCETLLNKIERLESKIVHQESSSSGGGPGTAIEPCFLLPYEFRFMVIRTGSEYSMKLTSFSDKEHYLCNGVGKWTVKEILSNIKMDIWRIVE